MCTWRVVSMCVAWSAYIKENATHLLCALYILNMCLHICEQRILIGFEPQLSYCLFTLHHYAFSLCIGLITITLRYLEHTIIS